MKPPANAAGEVQYLGRTRKKNFKALVGSLNYVRLYL